MTVRGVLKRLLILPPLALGIALLVYVTQQRQGPERPPLSERASSVRVIEAAALTVVPRAHGFGSVAPARDWKAVAQVTGKLIEHHDKLEEGRIIPEGAVLLRVDPADYELAQTQAEANISGAKAELAELEVKHQNIIRSLKIEHRALELSQRKMKRKQGLLSRGNIAQAAVDEHEREVLSTQQRAQDLENNLLLIPAERDVLKAKLALHRAALSQARLDLERTTITAPFDLRIAKVDVERAQFVRNGDVLVEAHGIDTAEVAAQFSIDKLVPLIPKGIDLSHLGTRELADAPARFGFKAVVRLRMGELQTQWQGRFTRVGDAVDPHTRTVGIIVAVDEPYRKARPGERPPLVKGMFVEVELIGRPKPAQLVVPRAALHPGANGEVSLYLAGAEDRLRRRPVTVGMEQQDFATITDGLEAGERVIVSDPVPAIEGMLLEVVSDQATVGRLTAQATDPGSSTP